MFDIEWLKADRRDRAGFTLTELVIIVALIGSLTAIAVPLLEESREQGKVERAIGDLRALETDVDIFELNQGRLPAGLSEIGKELIDPWGFPYVYLRFSDADQSHARLDKNLKPINTSYDLYSIGRDGATRPPLTARPSRDDIVRANDGGFIGVATEY